MIFAALRILVLGVLMLRIRVLRVPVYPSLEGEKRRKGEKPAGELPTFQGEYK